MLSLASAYLSWRDGLGMFPGPQSERRDLGGLVYFLLIFVVISNVEAYWDRIK